MHIKSVCIAAILGLSLASGAPARAQEVAAIAAISPLEAGREAYTAGDFKTALSLIKPLAKAGDPVAQVYLGFMYAQGQGVRQDYRTAAGWFEKAALQGNAEGQYQLGFMYSQGDGVPLDFATAFDWLRKSANQGMAKAQFYLGINMLALVLVSRKIVPAEEAEACRWIQTAADQGFTVAQSSIGRDYAEGSEGKAQDKVQAYMWFSLAAQGAKGQADADDYDKDRDQIKSQMTADEIAQGDAAVQAWKPVSYGP